MTASAWTDEFEELRPHLLAVGYRLTGTYADAEDIVQDAWLRRHGTGEQIVDRLDVVGADLLREADQQPCALQGTEQPEKLEFLPQRMFGKGGPVEGPAWHRIVRG